MKDRFVMILDNIKLKDESVVLRDCSDLLDISSDVLSTSSGGKTRSDPRN
jgi:hypothetical protein